MSDSGPRAMTIFGNALELPSNEERARYLDGACSGEPELRSRIDRLLRAHSEAGNFLGGVGAAPSQPGARDGADQQFVCDMPDKRVGPYKILEQIGEGGFGVVFMAEQEHPVRRRVALKVIKPGMDTRQVIARFEAERQALALMDHPNIARVLDAGETSGGRPYFVMELIRGIPITQYCDQNNLAPRDRLGLFVSVCQAIQHAHQKGIIHRDLKPSNALVTLHDGTAVVKVIDFGIAKAMGQQLTEKTLFTNFASMVGTPLYMSPEQAEMSGLNVDTRTDVYSLGVLLYELLTGTTPFDAERLKRAGFDEVRRIIRQEDPPPPSTRVSALGPALGAVSAQRKVEPAQLGRLMRGELDWIVMKALSKDRRQRYETAGALAADVQHYLNNESVTACPPSALYRLRKFASRYRAAAAAVIATVLALLLGTAVSTWQAVRATRAETLAQKRLDGEAAQRRQAEEAKQAAKRALFEAKLVQAQAGRASRRVGQRFESWKALSDAAALSRELGMGDDRLLALRNEAIACLSLPDVRPVKGPWGISAGPASWPAEFDPELRHCARVDSQGGVSVHRVEDDRELARLAGSGPAELTFSPDGVYLAIARQSGVVVWDWQGNGTIFEAPTPLYNFAVAFSPDRRLLALGKADHIVSVHELASGQLTHSLSPGMGARHLAFRPDGGALAFSGQRELHVFDLTSGRRTCKVEHPDLVTRLTWHEDGDLLAVACQDHYVYVWDTTTARLHTQVRHVNPQRAVYPHGGDLLLSWGWDDTSRLWNVWTGQELLRIPGAAGQLSRDGERLATQTGRDLTLWELASGREYRTLPRRRVSDKEALWEGDLSPDGRWLAQGTDQGLRLWDVARGKGGTLIKGPRVTDARFHPSGKWFYTSGPGGLFCWPLESRPGALRIGPPRKLPMTGYLERIGFDREGKTLAVADLRAGVRVLDLNDPSAPARLFRHPRATWACVSPDGRWVVSCTHNGSGIKVWDVVSGKAARDLAEDNHAATLSFSPDGKWLVTATSSEFAIWAVESWTLTRRIPREQSFNTGSAAFSRDGRVLAVTLAPSTVDLRDSTDGRHLARLQAPDTGWLSLIGFSPDGSQLCAYGAWDTCVWDLRQIGDRLQEIGLGWDLAPMGPPPPAPVPVRVEYAGPETATGQNAPADRKEEQK